MDLNRVMIIGRLTQDPELRSTATGRSVASFGVATGRVWKDANGQKQQQTEFHNVVLWSKLGEIANQYLRKGRKVYIEGRMQTRNWVGQDGLKRYRTEVIGENMIMLDGPRGEGAGPAPVVAAPLEAGPVAGPAEVIEEEIRVEDIPF
ncbi:single-stranded DNA-binding protein [Patescibacteria group bacterium]|nr:MAG: single-stranded DNA-binding protein [Patescibacteria group bacterium]